jgi:hypothetical protein
VGKGGLQLGERSRVLGSPGLLGGGSRLAGGGGYLAVLIAEQPVRGLVAPIIAASFTSGRALLPAARCQVPFGPFFANRHPGIVDRVLWRSLVVSAEQDADVAQIVPRGAGEHGVTERGEEREGIEGG